MVEYHLLQLGDNFGTQLDGSALIPVNIVNKHDVVFIQRWNYLHDGC